MNLRLAPLLLTSALMLAASSAHAQTALLAGLGGPADYGPNNLPGNDDGSVMSAIDVSAAFPNGLDFFGMTFRSLWLNNNGNITFGGPLGTFTPQAFPVASERMIAPWWGDVDTRGGGVPNRNGVYWSVTPGQFVATWHNVGYYGTHDDLLNDFQLILRSAGCATGDFDVEFRYHQLQWTTGDASGGSRGFGGTPAQAGFDAGDNRNYTALPGSLTMAVLDLATTSNVGVNGVWRFAIRGGGVMCPGECLPCTTGQPGLCSPGITHCAGMAPICVQNVQPSPEICDGLDQDCDGTTDEELGSTTCGIGDCVTSVFNCVNAMNQTCVPLPPHDEMCDGRDNDCDATTDEDLGTISCGIGVCSNTVPACVAARMQICVPGRPTPEVCNGYDDDCNGLVDDGLDQCMARPDAAFWDAGLDAGRDAGVDAGPMRDGGSSMDAAVDCPRCRLNGRAGPGCTCRVGERSEHGPLALGVLLAIAIALRARSEMTDQRGRRGAARARR